MKNETMLKSNAIKYMIYSIPIFLHTRKLIINATGEAYFITFIIVIGYLKAEAAPKTTQRQRIIAISLFLLCRSNNC
jgi:hypothetical protein